MLIHLSYSSFLVCSHIITFLPVLSLGNRSGHMHGLLLISASFYWCPFMVLHLLAVKWTICLPAAEVIIAGQVVLLWGPGNNDCVPLSFLPERKYQKMRAQKCSTSGSSWNGPISNSPIKQFSQVIGQNGSFTRKAFLWLKCPAGARQDTGGVL